MTTKFTVLIIDDRIEQPSNVLELLRTKMFLRSVRGKIEPSGWRTNDVDVIDCRILDSETSSFCDALRELRDGGSRYDFFFIDLALVEKSSPINPLHEDNDCSEAVTFKLAQKLDELTGFDKLTIAGLSFIQTLPIDERPKIIYSGHKDTARFRKATLEWQSRLGDIVVLSIDKTGESDSVSGDIVTPLEKYLASRQREILYRSSPEIREQIKTRIYADGAVEDAFIPDPHNEGGLWSLATLFPREINFIRKNRDVEEMKSRILKMVDCVNWRFLVSRIMSHPESSRTSDELISDVEHIRSIDFRVAIQSTGAKKASCYEGMQLSRFCESPSYDSIKQTVIAEERFRLLGPAARERLALTIRSYFVLLRASRDDLSEQELTEVSDHLAAVEPEKLTGDLMHRVVEWMGQELGNWKALSENQGIYPPDIAYVTHVMFKNSDYSGQPVFDWVEPKLGDNEIVFTWHHPKRTDEQVINNSSYLFHKLQVNPLKGENYLELNDEGVTDVVKIICLRYQGALEFRSGRAALVAEAHDGKVVPEVRHGCPVDIEGTDFVARIPTLSRLRILMEA